jgi:hypothetical protein
MDASGPTHLDRLQVRAENLYLPASRLTFLQSARPQHVPNHYTVVGLTDVGQTRSRNEDSLAILPDLGVAVVADGMGGHPGGDVASRVAAEAATRSLAESLPGTEYPKEVMRSSVISAHEAIRLAVEKDPELEGMGTTSRARSSAGSAPRSNAGVPRRRRMPPELDPHELGDVRPGLRDSRHRDRPETTAPRPRAGEGH